MISFILVLRKYLRNQLRVRIHRFPTNLGREDPERVTPRRISSRPSSFGGHNSEERKMAVLKGVKLGGKKSAGLKLKGDYKGGAFGKKSTKAPKAKSV